MSVILNLAEKICKNNQWHIFLYFVAFCYATRGNTGSCNAKEGNPFGPFWDTYGVDFVGSEFYGPLHYDVYHTDIAQQWQKKYPSSSWPVLAFTGAPASFPVQAENRILAKCLHWNNNMLDRAKKFIKETLPRGGFVGIHLRNGIDWVSKLLCLNHNKFCLWRV